jgi:predicted O-methyltransferase YrrM
MKSSGPSPSRQHTSQSDLADAEVRVLQQAESFFDAINEAEALQLYSAVRELRPAASAEIGFCCGGSGLAILKALEDNGQGVHHACDPYQASYAHRAGLRNVEAAGLAGRLRFHEAFPEEVVPSLPRLQFAFIDASHLFDLSIHDFVLIDKRLDVDGVVGFHDLWMPSLRKVVRYILANRAYEVYSADGDSPSHGKATLIRRFVAAAARSIPRASEFFSQEVLHPWASLGVTGNLALLRKTAYDGRDWRHFVPF